MNLRAYKCPSCASNISTAEIDGRFTCRHCGTQSQIPNDSQQIIVVPTEPDVIVTGNKFLLLGMEAYKAENFQEAYSYFTSAIEICPDMPTAWLLKGLSAGWLSTAREIEYQGIKNGVENAFKYIKDDSDKKKLISMFQLLGTALIVGNNGLIKQLNRYHQKYNDLDGTQQEVEDGVKKIMKLLFMTIEITGSTDYLRQGLREILGIQSRAGIRLLEDDRLKISEYLNKNSPQAPTLIQIQKSTQSINQSTFNTDKILKWIFIACIVFFSIIYITTRAKEFKKPQAMPTTADTHGMPIKSSIKIETMTQRAASYMIQKWQNDAISQGLTDSQIDDYVAKQAEISRNKEWVISTEDDGRIKSVIIRERYKIEQKQ